jgi:hypothetical protein
MKSIIINAMKINIIYAIVLFVIILMSIAYGAEYKPFIGKTITYHNTDNNQINKNEHLGRLKDQLKSFNVGLTLFKKDNFLSCSTNRLLQQSTKIRFLNGHIKRKLLNDSCALGKTFKTKYIKSSTSIILSNVNIYDNYNGLITKKSTLLKGLGAGIFKGNNYYAIYWFDRNNELSLKNAFGIVYNKYF